MREELEGNDGKAIDERVYVAHRPHIVWKQIAWFLTKRFGDAHEILDIQPALPCLQPGEVGWRDRHGFRYFSLAPPLRLAEMPEDAPIHDFLGCTTPAM